MDVLFTLTIQKVVVEALVLSASSGPEQLGCHPGQPGRARHVRLELLEHCRGDLFLQLLRKILLRSAAIGPGAEKKN